MKVGWIADSVVEPGGAELTQFEFRTAAPDDVEIVDCPPGAVTPGLDRYVVHNHMTYSHSDFQVGTQARFIRYHHDVREQLLDNPHVSIFCSPLQAAKAGEWAANRREVIPPALNLAAFRKAAEARPDSALTGSACAVGSWQNLGKGQQLLAEWATEAMPLDVYGTGPFPPAGPNINFKGPVAYPDLPALLASYEFFVHLPTALEPFGRAVVEAWAAGCRVITNDNVGANRWLGKPALDTAAADFWEVVCG